MNPLSAMYINNRIKYFQTQHKNTFNIFKYMTQLFSFWQLCSQFISLFNK